MKKNRLLLMALMLFTCGVNAQNWNFIKSNERYHFQHVDDEIPLNTIFADSTALVGTDSVLYLNRLFLECDTCFVENEAGYKYQYGLHDQPGFLEREVIYSQVSSTVVLNDPKQSIIKLPNLGIKEWWFNKEKNQKAELGTISFEEVLGVQDSVATILIDGEPQIRIAKELGLIQYFDYFLLGLEDAGLGETLPTWKDFYDFNIGDEYHYYETYSDWITPMADIFHKKKTVTDVYVSDSIIKVKFRTLTRWDFQMMDSVIISDKIVNEEYLRNDLADVFPSKLIDMGSDNSYTLPIYTLDGDMIKLSYKDSIVYSKMYDDDFYYKNITSDRFDIRFEAGKSEVFRRIFMYGDTEQFIELVGTVKNGITEGQLHSDSLFMYDDITSINESILQNLKIAPNPSQGEISFELGNYQQAQVKVYTLHGKKVEQFVVENNETQNLQHLNAGIYLITIEVPEGVQQIKWVKQ